MRTTRSIVLVGALLLIGAMLPSAVAHDAADGTGSKTSFGFGGAADPDPCRFESRDADLLTGGLETGLDACPYNDGVAGTYLGSAAGVGVVECGAVHDPDYLDGQCHSILFEPEDWGARTFGIVCDVEAFGVEEYNNGNHGGGFLPDGSFDDGGIGGACHSENSDSCSGAAFAQDWLLGDDVPLLTFCDEASESASATLTEVVNCLLPPASVDCAIDEVLSDDGVFVSCFPDGAPDARALGAGDGHGTNDGTGVPIPSASTGCSGGNIAIAATPLISANPFRDDVGGSSEDFGWLGEGPDFSGAGHQMVYLPAGGWIEQA